MRRWWRRSWRHPICHKSVLLVCNKCYDWLMIDYLLFYVPLKNISLKWRRHHCRWRAAKFRPMLGTHGLWAWRNLYRATPTVTRDLGFFGLIRRATSFSRLLRHAWGRGGPILTRILTGLTIGNLWFLACLFLSIDIDILAVWPLQMTQFRFVVIRDNSISITCWKSSCCDAKTSIL
jgi:hypothetical protein